MKKNKFNETIFITVINYLCWVLNFVKSIILARLIAPEYFGILAMAGVFFVIFYKLHDLFGIKYALIHRTHDIKGYQTYFITSVFLSIISLICIGIISIILKNKYDPLVISSIIIISCSIFIELFLNIFLIKLEKELKFKELAYIKIFSDILTFIIVVFLSFKRDFFTALVIERCISVILPGLIGCIISNWHPSIKFDFKDFKWFFNYGKFFWIFQITSTINYQMVDFLVGTYYGLTNLGFYNKGFNFAKMPLIIFVHGFIGNLKPIYAFLQMRKRLLSLVLIFFSSLLYRIILLMSLILILCSRDLILIIFGEKWLGMVPYFNVFLIFILIRTINDSLGEFLYAIGRPNIVIKREIIQSIMLLFIIFFLLMHYKAIGASYAMLISCFFSSVFLLKKIKKLYSIPIFKVFIIPSLLACLISKIYKYLILFIHCQNIYNFILIKIFLIFILYLLISYIFEFKFLYYLFKQVKILKKISTKIE